MVSRGKYRRKTCKVCGSEIRRMRKTESRRGRVFCPVGHERWDG